jgi:hypothetical protein
MRKRTYFASRRQEGWPAPSDLEDYFLATEGKRWFFDTGNDSGGFSAEGLENTGELLPGAGRIDIHLELYGHPELGVLLLYQKTGREGRGAFSSKGDLTKLREWVRTLHNDPMPVGLFIPYEKAWLAVKEFIETDGALPKSIEWVANSDLPPETFPEPL